MSNLRVNVNCFKCGEEVEKNAARPIEAVNKEARYECFTCFRSDKTEPWGFGDEIQEKKELYCERCRYKFSSKISMCPYCNKQDQVVPGEVTVRDLL